MAKKKSPNAALIEALKPPKPIPYDPELMQALAAAADRDWQRLEILRRESYRRVMPTIWTELLDAERDGDAEQMKAIEVRADRQWSEAMGVPAITSWPNLAVVMATVAAAGYPATDAGLHAWVIAAVTKEEGAKSDFVPGEFQQSILKALDGRALKKQPLADEICKGDGKRLYKAHGLKELRDIGRVAHKYGLGFYRPDAPPAPK